MILVKNQDSKALQLCLNCFPKLDGCRTQSSGKEEPTAALALREDHIVMGVEGAEDMDTYTSGKEG